MSKLHSITIASCAIENKTSKAGKPYEQWAVYDAAGKKYSPFVGDWNRSWKAGDVVEFSYKKNGQYFNVVPPIYDEGGLSPQVGNIVLENQSSGLSGGNLSQVMDRFDQIDAKLQRLEEAMVVMGAFGPKT